MKSERTIKQKLRDIDKMDESTNAIERQCSRLVGETLRWVLGEGGIGCEQIIEARYAIEEHKHV